MSKAHFETSGMLELASKPQDATLTIDRDTNLVHVRVKGRRKVYTVPLSAVAEWIVRGQMKAEMEESRPRRRTRTVSRGLLSVK